MEPCTDWEVKINYGRLPTKMYTGLWNKYRPAILRMMIEAGHEPQRYQLSNHEFNAFSNQKKEVYAFALEVANGGVISGLKNSLVAQGLWEILQLSPRATELISNAAYHFSMDKKFLFCVQKEISKS